MKLSKRVTRLRASATRAVSEKAGELRRQGRDVVSLSVGEPDCVSPDEIMDAARAALADGHTFYTPTAGVPELRQAVAEYYRERFALDYTPCEVMIGSGAKPLIYEACAALLDPGDEAIVIAPAWVSYIEQIRLCDAEPVIVATDPETLDFGLADIEAAITERTRLIMLNSPNNPSGRIFGDDIIKGLCELAMRHDLIIVNDEIYERITFKGARYANPLNLCPEARDHVLNINGCSKSYAMTGWRIGFALGPQALIRPMTKFQGHNTSGPNSVAQWAAIGALRNSQTSVERMRADFQYRKDAIIDRLSAMPYLRCIPPQGAFYAFADITGTYGKTSRGQAITDDLTFCELLIEHAEVAAIPGSAFLQPGFFRMSFATSPKEIERGMDRLHTFLADLA